MSYVNGLTLSPNEKNMLFRDATATLLAGINKTPDFVFQALEPCDTTATYAKAKVKVPEDSRFTSNWGIIELLFYKVFRNGQDGVRPGAVLTLEAHRVGESLLEAQISYAEGSLIATASAIYSPMLTTKNEGKCLAAPIEFDTTNAKHTVSPMAASLDSLDLPPRF